MSEILTADILIQHMDQVRRLAQSFRPIDIPKDIRESGLSSSSAACQQQKIVPATPIFTNVLKQKDGKRRLNVDDPLTEAEKFIYSLTREKLAHYIGIEQLEYNINGDICDPDLYRVDCYRNLKENMRDIVPGQAEQRKANIAEFKAQPRDMGVRELLRSDPLFLKAVSMVFDVLPPFKCAEDIHEINLPFMKKKTGTCYPYFKNDATVDPNTGMTYGEITIAEAREIWKDGVDPMQAINELAQYLVWTALGRNQRGKGRGLIASSRIVNLIINLIQAPEIAAAKERSSVFAGYKGPQDLKKVMVDMAKACRKEGLWAANTDQSKYDQHVAADLIELIGALAVLKANGTKAKALAIARAAFCIHGQLIDGTTGKVEEIFGRIFSGYIDTNLMGGKINAIITLFVLMVMFPNYSNIWYNHLYCILVMGDDVLALQPRGQHRKEFTDVMLDKCGFEVHPDKGEEGIFFLQRRIIEVDNEFIMVVPVTRVIKSLCFKEHSSSLGPYGWLAATLQILSQVMEYPAAMDVVVSVLFPYDKMRMGIDLTSKELGQLIKVEDQQAYDNMMPKKATHRASGRGHMSKAARQRRFRATSELLFDGDPTKEGFWSGDELNHEFVDQVIAAVRASVQRTGVKTLVGLQANVEQPGGGENDGSEAGE